MAIHEASGAVKKNKKRFADRQELRVDTPLGGPPESFLNAKSPTALQNLAAWKDLVAGVPAGVLTIMDKPYMENLSVLYANSRRTRARSDLKAFHEALKEAPFTPAARTRFAMKREKAADLKNRFSEFADSALPPRVM